MKRGKILNSKGVFITLSIVFIAGMLFLAAANIESAKSLEERAIVFGIASQKTYFVKDNALDAIKTIYANSAINWSANDTNFTYFESLPNNYGKTKLVTNLSKLRGFFYQEFPRNSDFNIESTDLGEIIVYGKDFNIKHSATTGFGTGNNLYFKFATKKFSAMQFDVNINTASISVLDQNLPLCVACINPLVMTINVKNSSGASVFTFNNTIDLSKSGSLVLNISPATPEVSFTYSSNAMQWSTASTDLNILTKTIFTDPLFEIGLNKNLIKIKEMSLFNVEG